MEKVRLGIIGYGAMGMPVARYIAVEGHCPEIQLTAVCDWDAGKLAEAEQNLQGKGITYFADAEEMMGSGLVDAIYIAVPHYDHPVLALKAFSKGLHVMTEKPAGVYTKKVREMNEAAKASGLKFGIMFQTRTYPGHQKLKELLDSGRYGQIRSINWLITNWYRSQAYYDSGSWRATWDGEGGGVLLNQCPHNLDVLQWLGGMPVEVSAQCSIAQWHNVEIEDDVVATLKYANGALGSFITSTGICPGTNRLEIATDRGTLTLQGGKLTVKELDKSLQEYAEMEKDAYPKITTIEYEFSQNKTPGHCIVLNAFAGAILRGTPLYVPGEEGIKSLTLSNAMYLSSWTGQKIQLPLDEDLYLEELNKRRATSKHKEAKAGKVDAAAMFLK